MSKNEISLGRRSCASRESRSVVLILCEGESEKLYLEHFKKRGSPVKVIACRSKKRNATGMMENCRMRMKEYGIDPKADSVFAVFDADVNDVDNIEKAIKMSQDVHLCLTNPCFEYWLILHFKDERRYVSEDTMEAELSVFLGHRYVKSSGLGRELTEDRISAAIERASKILSKDDDAMKCKNTAPSTMMHGLVTHLRERDTDSGAVR